MKGPTKEEIYQITHPHGGISGGMGELWFLSDKARKKWVLFVEELCKDPENFMQVVKGRFVEPEELKEEKT